MASAELWPSSAERIPLFVVPKRLRAFRNYFFTGTFPLYDRIMNLYKHFCKGLDSRAKTVIMVLALRNKEC